MGRGKARFDDAEDEQWVHAEGTLRAALRWCAGRHGQRAERRRISATSGRVARQTGAAKVRQHAHRSTELTSAPRTRERCTAAGP